MRPGRAADYSPLHFTFFTTDLENKNTVYDFTIFLNLHSSHAFRVDRFQVPQFKSENPRINDLPSKNNVLVMFIVFFLFAETLWCELPLFHLHLLEQNTVWLKKLFGLSNNFDALLH